MQKSLLVQSFFRSYLIPILLLTGSFFLYSYNLEGQPWHGDESIYLGWGGAYFDLIKEGDFNNPCLRSLIGCELLYSPPITGGITNYTPVRNFFVGFSQYLTTGENEGDFYEWSCFWFSCWSSESYLTSEEHSSGRFLSTVFGSLTIVIAFFIGKILFNRITGLFFSLILLFYSLWMMFSRTIMSEVYVHFFILLAILLLLKSFKKEGNHRVPFFVFGAISFGIALNIKLIVIELAVPILVMILFYDSFNKKLNFRFFKNRKSVLKVISLVLVFFVISFISFIATYPRYYENTFSQISKVSDQVQFGFASFPTIEKNYLFRTLVTLQNTLLPYLINSNTYDPSSDDVLINNMSIPPFNYSTIPLSLFFFIGLINMIRKIKTKNLKFSEFILLAWFTSLFIFTVLTVDVPYAERYYLPLMFPIILIASHALGEFIKQIQNYGEKILFFMLFTIAHSLYIISFFDEIYFSYAWWHNPLPVSSQLSLIDPLVYVSTTIFVGISFLIYLRVKMRVRVETK